MVGIAPARRAGATLTSVGNDLVLYGGDKSLAIVCHAPPAESGHGWQWFPTPEEERPPARKGHAAAALPGCQQVLVYSGVGLEGDLTELADVRILASQGTSFAGTSWIWQAAGPTPQPHHRADGSEVPSPRSGHCLVALSATMLLLFGGESQGQLLQELCLLDTSDKVRGRGDPDKGSG